MATLRWRIIGIKSYIPAKVAVWVRMRISIIVAIAENGLIGCDGDLPWEALEDLKPFKETTMGKPIIMGVRRGNRLGVRYQADRTLSLAETRIMLPMV